MSTNVTKMRVKGVIYNLNGKLYDTSGCNTDGSITQSALTNKFNAIEEDIDGAGGFVELDYSIEPLSSQTRVGFINSSNQWKTGTASSNNFIIVDIRNYRGWKLTTLRSADQFAWLTRDDNPFTDGATPAFVSGTGRFGTGELTDEIIPDAASYLYVYIASGSSKPMLTFTKEHINGIKDKISILEDSAITKDILFEKAKGKNLIDESNVIFDARPSGTNGKIQADSTLNIAMTQLIEVTPGVTYSLSGQFYGNGYGAYYGENATTEIGQTGIEMISTVLAPLGDGRVFTVPNNNNIKYVIIVLKAQNHNQLLGSCQLERGEVPTAYELYTENDKIKEEFLPEYSSYETSDTMLDYYTDITTLTYPNISDKFPNFREHWILKDKDLVVVNTGTSLTARTIEHCTEREDAAYRPPLLHSNNIASMIWDKIKWEGQEYRRYDSNTEHDGSTNMFTETGTFATSFNLSEWDDGGFRNGLTRYASGSCSVQFTIPADAHQFNFIYRTDSIGSTACTVSVTSGTVQVYNGSGWIEANGFSFSMRESAVTILPSVTYKNPYTGSNETIENVQVKGNTTYQKRLKFRAVSNSAAKTITISSSSGRFMYWGVEYSPRDYMITYINAARGEHSSRLDNPDGTLKLLINYQDNEIWDFNPDLICAEDPIHNYGGAKLGEYHTKTFFAQASENFFFADNGISMLSRLNTLGKNVPEFIIHNSSVCRNFLTENNVSLLVNGDLPVVHIKDGSTNKIGWTALDAQSSIYLYMLENHSNIIYINAFRNWIEACNKCYGNLENATTGTRKNGNTFSDEGSHYNDTGCKVMARVILPVFDFIV